MIFSLPLFGAMLIVSYGPRAKMTPGPGRV